MAKTYTSTIEINCRKEHTCVGCGAIYSYPFKRKIVGSAPSAERARINCQNNVTKALANDVDQHPCPTCGVYQPDMIGQKRRKRHLWIFWLGIITFIVLMSVRLGNGLQSNQTTDYLAIVCGALLAAHAIVEMSPNKNLDSNASVSMQRVTEGKILLVPGHAENLTDEAVNPIRSTGHRLAIPMIFAGAVLVLLPELARQQNHWPLNQECYPPVVGAGDMTRIYMRDQITSIKSYWRGKPAVILTPKGEKSITATATANQNDWGNSISFKSEEKRSQSTPWAEVQMPSQDLTGKTVDCSIELAVEYPQLDSDGSEFRTAHQMMNRDVSIQMAPPHAGARYQTWWWQGTTAGAGLSVVAGIVLVKAAGRLQRRAKPTRVFT